MAAANGGIESDYGSGAEGSDEDREGARAGAGYGDAPFRFRTSEVAPWGEGDRPLIKVGGVGATRGGRASSCFACLSYYTIDHGRRGDGGRWRQH